MYTDRFRVFEHEKFDKFPIDGDTNRLVTIQYI